MHQSRKASIEAVETRLPAIEASILPFSVACLHLVADHILIFLISFTVNRHPFGYLTSTYSSPSTRSFYRSPDQTYLTNYADLHAPQCSPGSAVLKASSSIPLLLAWVKMFSAETGDRKARRPRGIRTKQRHVSEDAKDYGVIAHSCAAQDRFRRALGEVKSGTTEMQADAVLDIAAHQIQVEEVQEEVNSRLQSCRLEGQPTPRRHRTSSSVKIEDGWEQQYRLESICDAGTDGLRGSRESARKTQRIKVCTACSNVSGADDSEPAYPPLSRPSPAPAETLQMARTTMNSFTGAASKEYSCEMRIESGRELHEKPRGFGQVASCFDGNADPSEGSKQGGIRPQQELATESARDSKSSTSNVQAAAKSISSTGAKSSWKVADRIRNFEQKAVSTSNVTTPQQTNSRTRIAKEETPLVFPLHVRKFRRRTSAGSPVPRAETPLYRSQLGDEQYLHAPTPQRRSTLVGTPPGTPPPLEAGQDLAEFALQQANDEATKSKQGNQEPKVVSGGLTNKSAPSASLTRPGQVEKDAAPSQPGPPNTSGAAPTTERPLQSPGSTSSRGLLSPAVSRQRVNPFAHFHGTRGACVRHRRKYSQGSKEQREVKATRDLFSRGRSGAFLPVGLPQLTNLDATSPWRYLTRRIDTTKSYSDACPDCVAELHIRKRELGQSAGEQTQSSGTEGLRRIATNDGPASSTATDSASLSVPPNTQSSSFAAKGVQKGAPCESSPEVKPKDSALPVSGHGDTGLSRGDTFGSTLVEPATSGRTTPRSSLYAVSAADSSEKGLSVKEEWPDSSSIVSKPSSTPDSASDAPSDSQFTMVSPRQKTVHFRDPSQNGEDRRLVISRDLGEGYDAMILERGGRLERLVMNSRHGQPNAETMVKIARELLMVASTLSDAQAGQSVESCATSDTDRTVLVDRAPRYENPSDASPEDVLTLFDEATGTLEPGLVMREHWHEGADGAYATPSPTHQHHVEDDYEALREHFGVNGPYCSFAGTDDDLRAHARSGPSRDEAPRWPIPLNSSFASAQSLMTDRYRDSSDEQTQPLPAVRAHSRSSNLGSEELPITISSPRARHPSAANEPTLPSHVLRAEDTGSPTPQDQISPLFFTHSTAPSLGGSSAEPSPLVPPALPITYGNPTSPPAVSSPTSASSGTPAATSTPPQRPQLPGAFPGLTRADSKVIRHVMRMEIQNKAVQEAAEKERQARRQRSILLDAKKALGFK